MDEYEAKSNGHPSATLKLILGLLVLIAAGFGAYRLLKPTAPFGSGADRDAFLEVGHDLYQSRCASCHGSTGRGDGPVAVTVGFPPPGDLTDGIWKHGDQPEQVLGVIASGVPGTGMSPWRGTLDEPELKAVAAYVYRLAGRDVPAALRAR